MITISKSHFGNTSVSFLGHQIDFHGLRPLPSKVMAILEYPESQYARANRAFSKFLNFYRRFVPHYAMLLQLL